jgi:hypothetical protein
MPRVTQHIVRFGLVLASVFAGAFALVLAVVLMAQHPARAQTLSREVVKDDDNRVTGILQSKPTTGTLGLWRIGNITVTANAETEFPHGSPALGACARADYRVSGGVKIAEEIRRSDDCSRDGDDDDDGEGDDDDDETKGIVQSFPANLIGVWQIGGKAYTATEATQFEQRDGPFSVGSCVEIKYLTESSLALRIQTDDDCDREGGEQHFAIAYGKLVSFPAELIGTWTINTYTYEVSTMTELERRHGDFFIGACVKVKYDPASATGLAYEIETESPDDCGERSGIVTPTLKAYGVITAMPEGSMFGVWYIGGNAYQAISGTTSFKQEHGVLDLDKCAEVKYYKQGEDRIAVRIESEGNDDCGRHGDDDDHDRPRRFEAYGVIASLPGTEDLIGTWMIGERAYSVTTATLLSNGPFTVGLFVEVHYSRTVDGGYLAIRIEGKSRVDDDDRKHGKAYGRIESRPVSPTVQGTWVIASVTYSVTNSTRLFGSLNISDCVQVHYRTDDDGLRIARKIKFDERCRVDAGRPVNKAHGFVTRMPAEGFVGTWEIGGVLYEAAASTRFSETHGALAVGAYVEVEFSVFRGVKSAREISTQVPPDTGAIDDKGKLTVNGAGLGPEATPTWTINGQTYLIVDATLLDDTLGALSNDQTVRVNAYVNGAGQRVATLVAAEGVSKVYVPVAYR